MRTGRAILSFCPGVAELADARTQNQGEAELQTTTDLNNLQGLSVAQRAAFSNLLFFAHSCSSLGYR